MEGAAQDEPLHVFGYGSLVWRCGFAHVSSTPACLRRWARVFHQGSTDHRGTPGAPGRVVTLTPDAGGCVWGVAYRLPPPGRSRDDALAYLEEREKQYDVRLRVALHGAEAAAAPGAAGDDAPLVHAALLCAPRPLRHRCSVRERLPHVRCSAHRARLSHLPHAPCAATRALRHCC